MVAIGVAVAAIGEDTTVAIGDIGEDIGIGMVADITTDIITAATHTTIATIIHTILDITTIVAITTHTTMTTIIHTMMMDHIFILDSKGSKTTVKALSKIDYLSWTVAFTVLLCRKKI